MLLSELCDTIRRQGFAARLDGADRAVGAVNTLEAAGPDDLSFLSNPKYASELAATGASAVILRDGIALPRGVSGIRCDEPYVAVTLAIVAIHGHRKHPVWDAAHRAGIHPSARIGANANIAATATVEADAQVGDRCTLYPGSYVGERTTMGDECVLFPNAVVYDGCILGNRVVVHAGSVIGQDGLGYAPHDEKWIKIPQIGRVVIGDDVEIGANCAIDRATVGQTQIDRGTKFGNDIVIGHGTKIGPDCLFVGQVGVAGSVTVGRHVTMAGQVGVAGHLTIGDDVRVAGKSGINSNVDAGADMLGSPAIPAARARRSYAVWPRLPQWVDRIRRLERELAELRDQVKKTTDSAARP